MYLRKVYTTSGSTSLGLVFKTDDEMRDVLAILPKSKRFSKLLLALEDYSLLRDLRVMVLVNMQRRVLFTSKTKTLVHKVMSLDEEEQGKIRQMMKGDMSICGFPLEFDGGMVQCFRKFTLDTIEDLAGIEDRLEDASIYLVGTVFYVFLQSSIDDNELQSSFAFSPCSNLLEAYCEERGKKIELEKIRPLYEGSVGIT